MSTEQSPSAMIPRLFLLFIVIIAACSPKKPINGPFTEGIILGVNTNERLEEASGLVASRRHPGMLWTHNDSGHPPELFLLDSLGETQRSFRIKGAKNRDWEDIAFGPGPDSLDCIYIGDIGDNNARHAVKIIYCVAEPSLEDADELQVVSKLLIRLADKKRDTETLLVDPNSRNLYLVSKREDNVWLYEIKLPFTGDTLIAQPVLQMPIHSIVAGDISPDGTEILLKSYKHIYYWKRLIHQSIPEALMAPPLELPYTREPLGESIAWSVDATGFYTMGENGKGERSKLYFYQRKRSKDSTQIQQTPGSIQ